MLALVEPPEDKGQGYEAERAERTYNERLEPLPIQAQVAFAVRCAQRVFPFSVFAPRFLSQKGGESSQAEQVLDAAHRAIELAKGFSHGIFTSYDECRRAAEAARAAAKAADVADLSPAAHAVAAAASAAETVGYGASSDYYAAIAAWEARVAAEAAATGHAAAQSAARAAAGAAISDLNNLNRWMSRWESRSSLVAQEFFERPLWKIDSPRAETKVFLDWFQGDVMRQFEAICRGANRLEYYEEWDRLHRGERSGPTPPRTKSGTGTSQAELPAEKPSAKDHLEREPLVEAFAGILLHEKQGTPLTVAIFGHWGSGKSSFKEQVKARMARLLQGKPKGQIRKALHAEFDAWSYEHCENLRAALAHEFVKGLTARHSVLDKVILALRLGLQRAWPAIRVFLVAAAILGVCIVIWERASTSPKLTGPADTVRQLWPEVRQFFESVEWLDDVLAAGGIGAAAILLYRLWKTLSHPLATNLATYLHLPDYRKDIGHTARIRRELECIAERCLGPRRVDWLCGRCKALGHHFFRLFIAPRRVDGESDDLPAKPRRRLVMWIEDLDRCGPEKVVEVFEAVRLVMQIPDVIVVFLMDERVALNALTQRFVQFAAGTTDPTKKVYSDATAQNLARDYLGKIIQIPVTLPEPERMDDFVKEQLFAGRLRPNRQQANPTADPQSSGPAVTADKPVGPEQASKESANSGPPEPKTSSVETDLDHHVLEHEAFVILTEQFDQKNPRKLLRIFNSYRLALAWYSQLKKTPAKDLLAESIILMVALFQAEHSPDCEVTQDRLRQPVKVLLGKLTELRSEDFQILRNVDQVENIDELLQLTRSLRLPGSGTGGGSAVPSDSAESDPASE